MGADGQLAPDWADGACYRSLLGADRSLIAWEWLRRDPGYRAAASRALQVEADGRAGLADDPGQWGLLAFEPPAATVPDARPLWSADVHAAVLKVDAVPPGAGEPFDPVRFAAHSRFFESAKGRQHLLIGDGLRTIRIDIMSGSIASGPVELRYRLSGLAAAHQPLMTLRRLLALWHSGRFCRSLHPPEARSRRWVHLLRAHDALAAGAGQREIAVVLLDADAHEPRWRSRWPSVRTRAQRLVRGARSMASGGYLELLR